MVINTRKLWGVTKKVQLITMRTLITMTFQMVLISWCTYGLKIVQKGHFRICPETFEFFQWHLAAEMGSKREGNVFVLVIFLHFLSCLACCVHTATKRERIGRNLLLCSLHTKETQKEKSSFHFIFKGCSLWLYTQDLGTFKNAFYRSNIV